MNNKKAKQMIESLTGAKYCHLKHNGKVESDYCLRFQGVPVVEIKPCVVRLIDHPLYEEIVNKINKGEIVFS